MNGHSKEEGEDKEEATSPAFKKEKEDRKRTEKKEEGKKDEKMSEGRKEEKRSEEKRKEEPRSRDEKVRYTKMIISCHKTLRKTDNDNIETKLF